MKNILPTRFLSLIVLCTALVTSARAEWRALPAISKVTMLTNGVELEADKARIEVTAMTDSVIHVRVAPQGSFSKLQSWAVVPEAKTWPPPLPRITDFAKGVQIATQKLRVRIGSN